MLKILFFRSMESQSGIDFEKLKTHFVKVQEVQQQKRKIIIKSK
jgi:hypothetical protein